MIIFSGICPHFLTYLRRVGLTTLPRVVLMKRGNNNLHLLISSDIENAKYAYKVQQINCSEEPKVKHLGFTAWSVNRKEVHCRISSVVPCSAKLTFPKCFLTITPVSILSVNTPEMRKSPSFSLRFPKKCALKRAVLNIDP